MTVVGIVLAILAFGIIIMVHECGHFFMAKKMGITVFEFSIGMGPTIFQKQKNGTKYSLRLFPIGGYVNMAGEGDDGSLEEDEENNEPEEVPCDENGNEIDVVTFSSKAPWKQALVLSAGVFMNLILGLILAIVITCMSTAIPSMEIARFSEGATSDSMLQVGDTLVVVDGVRVRIDMDLSYALQQIKGDTTTIVVRRDGELITLENVPFTREVDPVSGATYLMVDFKVKPIPLTPWTVLKQSILYIWSTIKIVWLSLWGMLTGQYSVNDLSGPIGATQQMGATLATYGLRSFLSIAFMIDVNVAVLNILPIPALDGFKLWVLGIEKITRRKISAKALNIVNLAGFAVLMLLMIYIAFHDVGRILGG